MKPEVKKILKIFNSAELTWAMVIGIVTGTSIFYYMFNKVIIGQGAILNTYLYSIGSFLIILIIGIIIYLIRRK